MFEARLAELDRRLRDLQVELAPDRTPRPPRPARERRKPPEPVAHVEPARAEAVEPARADGVEPARAEAVEPAPVVAGRAQIGAEPPPASPPPPPREAPRGRAGPLADVLQHAPRHDPGPPQPPPPTEQPPRAEPPPRAEQPPPAEPPPRAEQPPPAEPPSGAEPPPPASPPTQAPADLDTMTELCSRLMASMRELLQGYETVLARRPAPAATREVTITAGPFEALAELRSFEAAVARLPGVREVTVRAYEGADRAIIDVRLDA